VETFDGTAELEGMEQGDGVVEVFLRWFAAGCGEMHRSQLFAVSVRMLLRKVVRRQQGQ
jgi:hypothetical protein